MKPGQRVAIWLHDKAAKQFLGLSDPRPVSRWVAVGTVEEVHETPVDITHIEERRPKEGGCAGEIKRVS